LAVNTHNEGPNISSLYAVMEVVKFVITDGPIKFPLSYPLTLTFLPSKASFPPSFSTVSNILWILSNEDLLVIGPRSTVLSVYGPSLRLLHFSIISSSQLIDYIIK